MGIVNATPDSFSGDGRPNVAAAVAHGVALAAAGADLLDVGAESTRPGALPVEADVELARLLPVVVALRAALPAMPLSIDTYKPEVFAAAHALGGTLFNSVRGLDAMMIATALRLGVPVVAMHAGSAAGAAGGPVRGVLRALRTMGDAAQRAGIARELVFLDPGIGFGKGPAENVALLGALDRLVGLGYPTLLGVSRKATLGVLTGRPAGDRDAATAAVVALACAAGIDVVRVHDVARAVDTVRVADAIARPGG